MARAPEQATPVTSTSSTLPAQGERRARSLVIRGESRAQALLRAVTAAQRRMLADDDADAVLEELLDAIAPAMGAAGALLGRPDEKTPRFLRFLASPGTPEILRPEAQSHLLRAWRENADVVVPAPGAADAASRPLPLLAMPFREGHRTLGVVCVWGFDPGDAAAVQEDLASLCATFAALAVVHQQRARPRLDVERIGQLLAIVSHELRTPLNAILGAVELLWESRLSEEQAGHLDLCRQAGANMLALVDDLVEVAMAEAGHVKLQIVPFEVREVVDGAIETISEEAWKKELELQAHVSPDVPAVLAGDPARLRQVLLNLLSNAVKFTRRGSIRLEVRPAPEGERPDVLLFSVKDTGIGIPRKNLESVFDRFSQVDASSTRAHGGTGLGLAICRHMVSLMEGRIWAESEMGKGTVVHFTARFGRSPGGAPRPSRVPPPKLSSVKDRGAAVAPAIAVLLAEDHPDNRLIVTAYLKSIPHRLTVAENGEQAVKAFREGTFDVVLMDIQMPVMDGFEATRRIRAFEREHGRRKTPVIALTAHVLNEEIDRAAAAGCDAHLAKPISKAALLAALERHAPPPAPPAPRGEEDLLAKVDPDLMDLIPGYIQNRFRDVAACRARLGPGKFDEIRVLAHGMAGSGGAYGFDEITRIGRILETAARVSDAAACAGAIDELEAYVRRVHAACE